MSKDNERDNDLSLQSCDFLAWRVIRAKRRYQNQHKREIVISRPRERSHAHEVH